MFAPLAERIAVRRRGFVVGSPPPMRAAMVISRMMRVKTRPRLASVAPFLCLIVAHFECPDMTHPSAVEFPAAALLIRAGAAAPSSGDQFSTVGDAVCRRPCGTQLCGTGSF